MQTHFVLVSSSGSNLKCWVEFTQNTSYKDWPLEEEEIWNLINSTEFLKATKMECRTSYIFKLLLSRSMITTESPLSTQTTLLTLWNIGVCTKHWTKNFKLPWKKKENYTIRWQLQYKNNWEIVYCDKKNCLKQKMVNLSSATDVKRWLPLLSKNAFSGRT